jgi:hypothetical protein
LAPKFSTQFGGSKQPREAAGGDEMGSVAGKLPKDTNICTYGTPFKIGISVTLETAEQAQALIDAIDILVPLFEKLEGDPVAVDAENKR